MTGLETLVEQGQLGHIDVQLSNVLARLSAPALHDAGHVRIVAATAALLSAGRARGHSCIDLSSNAGAAPWPGVELQLPDAASWRAILAQSGVCGDGTAPTPLVLDGDRLYLYRYHAAERRLASALRARIASDRDRDSDSVPHPDTVALFRRLFPPGADTNTDWQAVAAAAALRNGVTVITGGPGTGKTTTVAKVLALLLQQEPGLRIAIAAPTGKAAARLGASITAAASLPGELARSMPRDARTLHRLLGYRPWDDCFAHDAQNPLADDVVVVDEASMVDVLLMDALFAALRPSARVILLGDQDQLASVDTGYVLGDLCRGAEAAGAEYGTAFCAWYEQLSGQRLATSAPGAASAPVRDVVVRLRRSYRFEQHPGIGLAAEAVKGGRAAAAIAVMDDAAYPEVVRRGAVRDLSELLAPVQDALAEYLSATDPSAALTLFSSFRVLCALREGRFGVAGLNAGVERQLLQQGVPTRARWYDKRPILITANDPSAALYNGDVGVVMTDTAGRTMAWFEDVHGGVRAVAPARLPAHETAWAMTVHKAQGSEFDRVLLVLPDEPSPVLTRELLYTALTRARRHVNIVGSAEMVTAAVESATRRTSGLAERLAP